MNVVYTPGFVKNGREFRRWNSGRKIIDRKAKKVGILKAEITGNKASIGFIPTTSLGTKITLNIALPGFDQKTDIAAGENSGRRLVHDFVVLDHHQHEQQTNGTSFHWTLDKLNENKLADVGGIALWVTAGNDPTPIQATGGFLQ